MVAQGDAGGLGGVERVDAETEEVRGGFLLQTDFLFGRSAGVDDGHGDVAGAVRVGDEGEEDFVLAGFG